MNHWPFIEAAYAITGVATGALLLLTILSMRRAERLTASPGDDR